jgi:hypothetical protein
MPVIKPKFDGAEDTSLQYDGPPPPPGPYKGVVKRLWLTEIGSGDNAGEDQLKVLVEIDTGKFKGAGFFYNLPMLKQSSWKINQFLDSMTDGSEKQRDVLRDWFWHKGYEVEPEEDKVGRPITKIIGGKKGFIPLGKSVGFITKMDSYNGSERAIIDRFVVPLEDSEPEAEVEAEVVEEAAIVDFPEQPDDPTPAPTESDDDDPWS